MEGQSVVRMIPKPGGAAQPPSAFSPRFFLGRIVAGSIFTTVNSRVFELSDLTGWTVASVFARSRNAELGMIRKFVSLWQRPGKRRVCLLVRAFASCELLEPRAMLVGHGNTLHTHSSRPMELMLEEGPRPTQYRS